MKGIVFAEFIEFVENGFSADIADQMIDSCDLPSQGAYTAVGTYDHGEMLMLVTTLSEITDRPAADLVHAFGRHLFGRLAAGYPQFLHGVSNSLDFMERIEDHIHVEVRKLYPDAELPRFEAKRISPTHLVLIYRSQRPFADLAMGLIRGCADHFGEELRISCDELVSSEKHAKRFDLIRLC